MICYFNKEQHSQNKNNKMLARKNILRSLSNKHTLKILSRNKRKTKIW